MRSLLRPRSPAGSFVLLVALLLAGGASAAEVVVVRSSDLAPYLQAQEGFSRGLGQTARLFTAAQVKAHESGSAEALEKAPLVLALGPDALSAVLSQNVKTPGVYALVNNPERIFGTASTDRW